MTLPVGWREAVEAGRRHKVWGTDPPWREVSIADFLLRLDRAIEKGGALWCSIKERDDSVPDMETFAGERVWEFHGEARPPIAMISVTPEEAAAMAEAKTIAPPKREEEPGDVDEDRKKKWKKPGGPI